jgi:hypothetical protein
MLLSACARDAAEREPSPPPPPEVKPAAVRVTSHTRRPVERHRHAPPVHRLDPALLAPQPAPDCDYPRSDLKTVDADEWAHLKSEYERQCYKDAEKAARERLGRLQTFIQQARD